MTSPPSQNCGGNARLTLCGGLFPDSLQFCCSQDTYCRWLFNSSSADIPDATLCCPLGTKCSILQPISCDLSQHNATLHPDNEYHMSVPADLPKCGDSGCCPLGYTCMMGMCNVLLSSAKASLQPPTIQPSQTTFLSSSFSSNQPSTSTSVLSASYPSQLPKPSSTTALPPRQSTANFVPKKIDVKVIALSTAFGSTFLLVFITIILLIRRHGQSIKRAKLGSVMKLSWGKAELGDTQSKRQQILPVELNAEREAAELNTPREIIELPG